MNEVSMTNQEASVPIATDPVYREIPLSELTVDPSYQRKVDQRWVKRTVATFDSSLLGVLMVASNGNGGYKVWDGQHRLAVLNVLGAGTAMCQVVEADQREQAALFTRQVNRRALSWHDRHRARLCEGERIALEIENIAASLGIEVRGDGARSAAPRIQAIGALYWIHASFGPDVLRDALRVAAQSWVGSPQRFADRVLKGVATFFAAYPAGDDPHSVDRDLAVKVFEEISPGRVLDDAAKMSRTPTGSNNNGAFAQLLVKHFNQRTGRRLRIDRIGGSKS